MNHQIPQVSYAVVGGSGTLSSDFPANLPDKDVKILEDNLYFATPYGQSPAMRLFSVGKESPVLPYAWLAQRCDQS